MTVFVLQLQLMPCILSIPSSVLETRRTVCAATCTFTFPASSVAGHVPAMPFMCMYSATKHAVTTLTEGLRKELVKRKSNIRVTVSIRLVCCCKLFYLGNEILISNLLLFQSLSPGVVKTEMSPEEILKISPALKPEDIAPGVLYALSAPPHVQVCGSACS
jgi:NADP-dependent 3-hydroxy acid dehydrogenase YdfG